MSAEPGKSVPSPRQRMVAAAVEAALLLTMILLFYQVFFPHRAGRDPEGFTAPKLFLLLSFLSCSVGVRTLRSRFGVGLFTLPVFMVALVVADVSRLLGLWPCDVGCQGGAYYQTVADISVVWPALIAHLALAALTVRDARHGGWCAWTRRSLGLLSGVSVFFLMIGLQLGLDCSFCFIVHATTLVAAGFAAPSPTPVRWWHQGAWPIAGWLIANAIFHHTPVADVSAPPSGTTPTVTQPLAGDAALLARINAGRTRGRADAPATLELALDLHCASCAKLHGPLMVALAPAITDGRLKVVIRLVVRPSHPIGRDSTRLVLAAAAVGEHDTALTTLLDSSPQSKPDGLRARLADVITIAPVDAVLRDHLTALDQTIDGDAARLAALRVGIKTPSAVLLRDGRELGRWSGEFAPALVVDALGR